jgi:hypothetical protein
LKISATPSEPPLYFSPLPPLVSFLCLFSKGLFSVPLSLPLLLLPLLFVLISFENGRKKKEIEKVKVWRDKETKKDMSYDL